MGKDAIGLDYSNFHLHTLFYREPIYTYFHHCLFFFSPQCSFAG